MSIIARFLRDETGATAIEYGLIAAGISVAIIATVAGLGTKLNIDLHFGGERAELGGVARPHGRGAQIHLRRGFGRSGGEWHFGDGDNETATSGP